MFIISLQRISKAEDTRFSNSTLLKFEAEAKGSQGQGRGRYQRLRGRGRVQYFGLEVSLKFETVGHGRTPLAKALSEAGLGKRRKAQFSDIFVVIPKTR